MTTHSGWTPPPTSGLIPLAPLGFGAILGKSFAALRGNPRVLFGFALGIQLVAYLAFSIAVGAIAVAAFSRLDTVQVGSEAYLAIVAGSSGIVAISATLLGLGVTAVSTVVQAVVCADVAAAVIGERRTLGVLWGRVRPSLWRLVGYAALAAVAAAIAVVIVALAVVAAWTASIALGIALLVLAALGAVVVSLWLGTKLYLVVPSIVLERRGVFGGIARSWRLVRTRFWPTLGILVIVQLLFSVISQAVSVPSSLLTSIAGTLLAPTGAPDETEVIVFVVGIVLTQVVVLLIQVIAVIVLATSSTLVYIDARMRREGLDFDLQSYVEQRLAGAGEADPYGWHIGREVPTTTTATP